MLLYIIKFLIKFILNIIIIFHIFFYLRQGKTFISELSTINRKGSAAIARNNVAALDHEIFDHSMKFRTEISNKINFILLSNSLINFGSVYYRLQQKWNIEISKNFSWNLLFIRNFSRYSVTSIYSYSICDLTKIFDCARYYVTIKMNLKSSEIFWFRGATVAEFSRAWVSATFDFKLNHVTYRFRHLSLKGWDENLHINLRSHVQVYFF